MAQPIVFFDIAGPDDEALKSFYSSIFGWEFDQAGQFDVPVATPIKGAIRKDPAEKRIYLGVTDVTASLSHRAVWRHSRCATIRSSRRSCTWTFSGPCW